MIVRCKFADVSEPVLFVVNHWKSRMARGVGPFRASRDREQTADWLGEWLSKSSRDTCVIAVGDFNSEPFERPFSEYRLRSTRHFSTATWTRDPRETALEITAREVRWKTEQRPAVSRQGIDVDRAAVEVDLHALRTSHIACHRRIPPATLQTPVGERRRCDAEDRRPDPDDRKRTRSNGGTAPSTRLPSTPEATARERDAAPNAAELGEVL